MTDRTTGKPGKVAQIADDSNSSYIGQSIPSTWATPILHVDMDAFFVEVERLTRPELVGVPVIVGGLGNRGVVASCSYEARAVGVHSAMPMAHARRLCPNAIYVAPTMQTYQQMSEQVFLLLRTVTPIVEPISVDEGFLDVSGLRRHHPDPHSVAVLIRKLIRAELGLPASVGIASNKFLAKLASNHAKPDGVHTVSEDQVSAFLNPLPVRALWGVGEATHAALEGLGVATVEDLLSVPAPALQSRLGSSLASHLRELARGHDSRSVEAGSGAKSISVEQTYARDIKGRNRLETELLAQSDRVASRLRQAGVSARTIGIKVRYAPFETISRSTTPPSAVDSSRAIYHLVLGLLDRIDLERPIRLVGVAATQLIDRHLPRQMSLPMNPTSQFGGNMGKADDAGSRTSSFVDALETGHDHKSGKHLAGSSPDGSGAWDHLADTVEDIRSRFGERAVRPARLADTPDVSDPDRLYGPREYRDKIGSSDSGEPGADDLNSD